MISRRSFLKISGASLAALYVSTRARFLFRAYATSQVTAVPLPGNQIPQFVDPLPDFVLVDGTNGSGGPGSLTIRMEEFQADVMPSTFAPSNGIPYSGTWVWGYQTDGYSTPIAPNGALNTYINPVILAQHNIPTEIRWINNLGSGAGSALYWQDWTDQTLHWAMHTHNFDHYTGTIPAVPHLHGGEVPPQLDGGPDAWFSSDGVMKGHAYYTKAGAADNEAIYRYPNSQEGATIWFHDHALGITRINVYAGLAGAYLLDDGNHPENLPELIPLVIQDRMFDINGQLYFPNIGDNPALHPFWVPEFIGDTIVVNGKVWPYKDVNRKRYTLFYLNGSNARFYDTFLIDPVSGVKGPAMHVISTDGGFLDNAVKIDPNATGQQVKAGVQKTLVIAPGERYQAIVDFNDPVWLSNLEAGYTALGLPMPATVNLHLRNEARTPFPDGGAAPNSTTGRIMEFRVNLTPVEDTSYNPVETPAIRSIPIIQLSDSTVNLTRQLTLNEVMGMAGPFEALVNNTKWDGKSVHKDLGTVNGVSFDADGVRSDFPLEINENYYSEIPKEGQTEIWEVINMTADAHPIHLHLVQFQLVNRQNFDLRGYTAAYDALFPASTAIDPMTGLPYPGGVFIGGYGPPLDYATGNPIALGGNPDVTPFLESKKGVPIIQPALEHEKGWKDTVIMYPGQVTRILVRWAPTDLAADTPPENAFFPFDPNGGLGYVWHCHIIDHEDNEMMRPDAVDPLGSPSNPGSPTRIYNQGTDF
jgi:FtsP/CotA-like multicopper oxidase with cupredoxin domain